MDIGLYTGMSFGLARSIFRSSRDLPGPLNTGAALNEVLFWVVACAQRGTLLSRSPHLPSDVLSPQLINGLLS